ncbi:MAG: CoA transferase, partial [Betaproteobacteria bacterium]|nr:CoA transferase [Betaproteobacteria bacterium]
MQPGTDQAACSPVESIKPLQGFKVVELHAIGPVPFAGYILAQLGAQVIRVSPPSDPQLGVGVAARFDLLNSNKSAHALDLKSRQGLDALDVLLEDADLLLEGFRPGVLERLGLEPKTVLERHPRLVIGRLSGWGQQGIWADRAGHDINYLAVAGILHAIGPSQT